MNKVLIRVAFVILTLVMFYNFFGVGGTVITPYLLITDGQGRTISTARMFDTVSVKESGGEFARVSFNGAEGYARGVQILGRDGFPLYDPEVGEKSTRVCSYGLSCNITNRTWFTSYPQRAEGYALYYARGVMEAQARRFGLDLNDYAGGLATASPKEIGNIYYLRGPNGWEGPFIVLDTMQRNHVWQNVSGHGYMLEVDWNTAVRWGMIARGEGRILVEMSKNTPYSIHPKVYFPEWWLEMAETPVNPQTNWTWTTVYWGWDR